MAPQAVHVPFSLKECRFYCEERRPEPIASNVGVNTLGRNNERNVVRCGERRSCSRARGLLRRFGIDGRISASATLKHVLVNACQAAVELQNCLRIAFLLVILRAVPLAVPPVVPSLWPWSFSYSCPLAVSLALPLILPLAPSLAVPLPVPFVYMFVWLGLSAAVVRSPFRLPLCSLF